MKMKHIAASVIALGLLASGSAMAASASVNSTISGMVAAAGSLTAGNVDVGVHSPVEFESLFFALPVTVDLTTGANGVIYVGTPGTPLPLNNGNSINVAGNTGTVWATIYQPGNAVVITSTAGMTVTGEGAPKAYNLGVKIQPQNNYLGSINGQATLTMQF